MTSHSNPDSTPARGESTAPAAPASSPARTEATTSAAPASAPSASAASATSATSSAGRDDLVDRIEALAQRYPNTRSAIIPALHLAQEHYGWLPPEAFDAVAEALETTPAFAQSVASFYDMFHLHPTGKHLIQVCTNVACALNGASAVVDEFEKQLGITAGGSTSDGLFTLETVECLGACGTAPTVAVNHRYKEHFERSQVKPLVTELKATPEGWAVEEGRV